MLNLNYLELWFVVKFGIEDIVGDLKFFIGKWSTFYDFYLGLYIIFNGLLVLNN